MSHFNNNPRDRGRFNQIPVRDNYYNNAHTPNFYDNSQERCLFTNGNNQFNNVTQNNNVKFDNSLKSDNRGRFLHEQDYVNKPLLDNNIYEEVRNEYIEEKDIIIDTMDRDTSLYPNIFDFRVKLGSTDTTPGPSIHRSVENVKYLKLVKCILPDNYRIKKTSITISAASTPLTAIRAYINANKANLVNSDTSKLDDYDTTNDNIYIIHYNSTGATGIFTIDFFTETGGVPDYSTVYSAEIDLTGADINAQVLSNNANNSDIDRFYSYTKDSNDEFQVEKGRFFQLHIDQLPKNNDLSTNDSVRGSFSVLYPGKEDDRGFNILDGMETDKIFRFSNLGTFNTMNIKILNCAGDQVNGDNSSMWNTELIASEKNSGKNITNDNTNTNTNFPSAFRSASKYLRHPLSWKMQANLIFTVGEVRIEMNKRTFN
jgi:hypothetical protein